MALMAVLSATCCVPKRGLANARETLKLPKLAVIGHRGKGMNILSSPDRWMTAFKENSILSFNEAARFPIDLVELDVQDKLMGRTIGGGHKEEASIACPISYSSFLPGEVAFVAGTTLQ